MRWSQKEVTSIETTFPRWAVFSLWFVLVGRVIRAQTTVPCAAFGCTNKSSNPGVEGIVVEYTHSLLFRSSGFIEEVAGQTGLELFSMPRLRLRCLMLHLAFFKCHNEKIIYDE